MRPRGGSRTAVAQLPYSAGLDGAKVSGIRCLRRAPGSIRAAPHTFCAKRRKNVEPEATVRQEDMRQCKPRTEKLLHDSAVGSIIATFGYC